MINFTMINFTMINCCLLFCACLLASQGNVKGRKTHSLQYFYTLVSGDIDLPELTLVGMVDHQPFMYFDSDKMKAEPKTEFIRADYWERETHLYISRYHKYRNKIRMIKDVLNQSMSADVHILQKTCGCELDDDGTVRGFSEMGYDGDDFFSFDKNTLIWTTANPQADIIKNNWETMRAEAEYCKAYLENTCIDQLKKTVRYGRNILKKKVAPEVSLLQKDSSSPVICHATGFYPKNITMTWKKNNEDHYEDVDISETLPNEDGTFQKSISLSVKSEEWKKNPDLYRCVIQHVGAEEEIVVSLIKSNIRSNEFHDSDDITAITMGCVLTLIVFISILGLILWSKSREVKLTGYIKGSNTKSNSDEQMIKNASL